MAAEETSAYSKSTVPPSSSGNRGLVELVIISLSIELLAPKPENLAGLFFISVEFCLQEVGRDFALSGRTLPTGP